MPKKIKSSQDLFLEVLNETKQEEHSHTETRKNLLKEYETLLKRTEKKKAYKVTFKNLKDLFYISFQEGNYQSSKYKATWEAVKYFQDNFHPVFLSENMLYQARICREKELDKYAKEGKIPILTLMETIGATFHCKACGKGKFDYEDYEFKRCYVTEEFDLYPFTKGIILCKNCFNKYMS